MDIVAAQAEHRVHIANINQKLDQMSTDLKDIRKSLGVHKNADIKRFHKILMIIIPSLIGSGGVGLIAKLLGM